MSQALLLAEAEPGTREFLARHLASDGFAVLGADAGREALELVERERPDLGLVGGLPPDPRRANRDEQGGPRAQPVFRQTSY
jgi:DNA-binding NtrC family response regulator